MNSVFNFFSPKDKKFQPLFERDIKNLVDISQVLVQIVTEESEELRQAHFRETERLEQAGDDIAHSIFLELSKNFITPFDREDIHSLVSAIDDIADYIYATSVNIELYRINSFSKEIIQLAVLINIMCTDLEIAILELRNLKNIKIIADICITINKGESEADHLCNTAIAHLFEVETDAIELIKQKEILQSLEMATDKCDDVANVLESILIKNA
jgi:predicted phosphate transport protein (TIGR00153 family)